MESLNKKSTAGISGGLSFASAAAAGANKPAATTPAAAATTATTTTTGPAKNGGAASGAASAASSSPALGSQSPAPSGTDSKTAATTTTTNMTTAAATTTNTNSNNGAIDWLLGMNVKVVTLADEVFEGQVYAYDVIMNCVCPSKSVSAATTPTAYYSPSLGNSNSNNNNNGNNGNAGARLKYDFRIVKINYIKDVIPLLSSAGSTSTITTPTAAPTTLAAGQNQNGQSKHNNSIPSSESTSTSEDNSNNNITNNIYSTVLPAVGYVQLDKIQQREQQAIREAQAAAARIGVGVSTIGQDIFDALSKTLPCRWHKDQIVVMDEVIISSPYEPDNCKANASAAATLARVKKVLEFERLRMANGRK